MESPDLNSLDGGPLADAGFSARVIASLPPRRRALRGLWILPLAGGLLGLALALLSGASLGEPLAALGKAGEWLNHPEALAAGAIVAGVLALTALADESEA